MLLRLLCVKRGKRREQQRACHGWQALMSTSHGGKIILFCRRVAFEEFVRPALLKMMGHHQLFRPVVEAVLKEEIKKEPGRRHFVRSTVAYEDGRFFVTTTGPQGSDKLTSMVKANGLMIIPEDREVVKAGETVKVQLLDCTLLSTKFQAPNPK